MRGVVTGRPFAGIALMLSPPRQSGKPLPRPGVRACSGPLAALRQTMLNRRPRQPLMPSAETGMPDLDDLTPEQRGAEPSPARRRARDQQLRRPLGRLGRPRSWLTALVALLALIACYW